VSGRSRDLPQPPIPATYRARAWYWCTRVLVLLMAMTTLPGQPRIFALGAAPQQFPRDPVRRQLQVTSGLWTDVAPGSLAASPLAQQITGPFRTLSVARAQLDAILAQAPREFTLAARNNNVQLELPWPDGGFRRFRIEESPIMEPGLEAQFPEIKTYRGQGLDDPTASLRMDLTPHGFHAMVLSADGTMYIDPHSAGDVTHYVSFFRRDLQRPDGAQFSCGVTSTGDQLHDRRDIDVYQLTHGSQLRTYRAAIGATVEYTAFHGGTVPGGLAGITTTLNRVNGIYERDLSVRMNLVANNNLVVFTAEPDGYTNNDGFALLGQNQTRLDTVIGTANYDIGHVFSTGGGGVATLRSSCAAGIKARGVTGLTTPIGDVFDVDYVAHEMGHQFGGNHTFNGSTGSCAGGNRNASAAYEPGSGSTIQAYAGICGAENLQSNSDAYFHAISQTEMIAFITSVSTGGSCPVVTATSNTPPTVNAGADFTIPQSTPFTVTAAGGDANGDSLTYTWEQFDLGAAGPPNTDNGTRPIFRSFLPTASPSRTFPRLQTVLTGAFVIGEAFATTTRLLNMRVTVRDNRSGGGGIASDDMVVSVNSLAGPFAITSQNAPVTYAANSAQTVTWNVASTTAAPVNTDNVKISLSTDGGLTFPTVILASTPNDGSQSVTIPNVATTTGRIKVEAVGNIYFDINSANVTITGAGGSITRSPAVLNFGATKNGAGGALVSVTPPQAVTVGYTGPVPNWTATSDRTWAVVTGGSGAGAGQFSVSIANPGNIIGGSTALAATITISSATSPPVTVAVNLAVQQTVGTSAVPFGQIDTPAQGAAGLQGAVGVTGWALDDVGVSTVSLYRPCLAFDNPASCQILQGNNLVLVGNGAFLAGARPDVEAAFPTLPRNYRAGWGIQILTNMLPHIPNGVLFGGQGTFLLYAYATDTEGNLTLLGRSSVDHTPTTVSVANDSIAKPFGTIDTPLPGAAVSGVVANFGWVLTPDTNTVPDGTDILMPLNGLTMTVYVDGLATAQVAYNQCRGTVGNPVPGGVFCNDDVANIFGQTAPAAPLTSRTSNPTRYRNLDAARGAIGAYSVNTALLTNGLHTIAWGVSDSAGRSEGIGSRFFTVLNGGSPRPPAAARPWGSAGAPLVGSGRRGSGDGGALDDLAAAPAQPRGVASSLDNLRRSRRPVSARRGFNPATPMQEIARRPDGVRTISLPSTGRAELRFASAVSGGYLVANGHLRDLPVGSRLDTRTGVFTWNPPPQYVGTYRLVFLIGGERVDVDVTIR
jgi:hypothetical protein